MKQTYISIVMPAYNEEQRISKCLLSINEFMKTQDYEYEVIVSDDGSTDKTIAIVEEFMHEWKSLKIIKNKHKGKAPAIISGVYASNSKFTLLTDVDLSVPINELPKLLNWVDEKGFDAAIASREGVGAKRINEPLSRHIMGRVFNLLVQSLVLPGVNDTQCGFKLFSSDVIKTVFKHTILYGVDDEEIKGAKVSAFDVELLYVAKLLGYKIKEVPVTWTYKDKSKVHNLKDSYYNAKDVVRVRLNSLKGLYKK
ncbi:glycosyl transferase [candidate division WWE3 bacterium CG_4_9_14_0_2_um_filter_35_11]|uniref:Glycosyl transferase n=1 Tax=candidate division WWE3 bacterium CG_4_9_14_0_2_um_filter_35_11 TaxID=1975077 RepID=A0A2M8ELQ5_UNCKA|nr:MAG: glycosyl transferase [candidate division WWE3 bacterium CG10_big_fil_rev_8_21_14_0_10_35_32]PJC23673.1 MAG: glycosyl transferase [candidate division WWE3 bacterium CG_4_9_14_0_2_um_filter_35_11]